MTVSMYSTLSSFIVQFSMDGILKRLIYSELSFILIMNASFMRFMKTPKKDNYLSRMFLLQIVMSYKCFLQKNILVQLGYLFDIYYLLGLNFWSAMPLILSFPSRHNFWVSQKHQYGKLGKIENWFLVVYFFYYANLLQFQWY